MEAHDGSTPETSSYPVAVRVQAALEDRNRLTVAFRFFLALPHMILVGAPVAMVTGTSWGTEGDVNYATGSGGLVGVVAWFAALLAWFAILFSGRHPASLRNLEVWYLRWRVRAIAYMTLLRDEYPPFGSGPYPVELDVPAPDARRNRLTVAFRLILAVPHMIVLTFLSLAWAFTTALGWAAILLTGRFPETLYGFGLGVLAWSIRVEAYLLLLRDEYPPFTLRV